MPGWLQTLAAAILLLASPVAARAEPLTIALIEAISGTSNATGHPYLSATRYALDKFNKAGGLNGEPVALKVFDSGGDPAIAAGKTRQALAEGARVIVQGTSSAVALAMADVINGYNDAHPGGEAIFLNTGSAAMAITGEKCSFYTFRYMPTAPIEITALVRAMKEEGALGQRVYAINQDYSWGREVAAAIMAAAPAGGYEVVDSVLHEVNRIQDFSPLVARIAASRPDTVITGNWSNDLLLMMKAVGEAHLQLRFGTTFLDQEGNISNAGDLAVGNYVVHTYNAALTDGSFVRDYEKTTGRFPSYVEPLAVRTLELFLTGLREAGLPPGGFDAAKVALALEKVVLQTDLGPVSIRREDHQVLAPIVVSRAEKGARYPVDGTDIGFRPVRLFPAGQITYPVQESCRMRRPPGSP